MIDMSDILFYFAAGLSLFGVIAHEVAGSPKVLGPLKTSGLPDSVIWLHHFSWHVGSVAVLAMISLFILAAWQPSGVLFAAVATAMSAGFAALCIGLATFGNPALWRTPAPYPWTLIAILGGVGMYFMERPL
ncbi:MAG: hypothetical protein VR74_02480 [Hyphomonas sp. BRH_c22]|uniref:hypothetical protein n=1 Tax=Hyphomonas sp. BRH_c22 TaxID=1629710 RepID=UPI0005F189A5|nr:hypothetical protein [Hyphomonas sp. BRH_c22]KJS39296.1 MAG: hypothetical protein VR74_02480 [Hyphomonas sp. BRH_c22]